MFNARFVPLCTVALCACLLPSALLCGCGGSSSTPVTVAATQTINADGTVTSAPRTYNNLQFTLTTNKAAYARGEAVQCTFAIKNIGAQTVTTNSSEGFYRYGVYQGGNLVGPELQGGGAVAYPLTFAPGETKTFTDTWDQKSQQNTAVAAGAYTLKFWLSATFLDNAPITSTQAQTLLTTNAVSITVQP